MRKQKVSRFQKVYCLRAIAKFLHREIYGIVKLAALVKSPIWRGLKIHSQIFQDTLIR